MLEDADGRSLLEIFSNPNTGYPHEFLLPQDRKRNTHSYRYCFSGTPHAEPMPTCSNPINHRKNCKKQEYFDIELPPHPFAEAIKKACITFEMNIWMLVSSTHGILYWYPCGCAWDIEYYQLPSSYSTDGRRNWSVDSQPAQIDHFHSSFGHTIVKAIRMARKIKDAPDG